MFSVLWFCMLTGLLLSSVFPEHVLEANLVALTSCASGHNAEQSWGYKLEFCWEELTWRTPITNCRYSLGVVDIQLTEMVKKPLSHLVFTDKQVLLSADLVLLRHNAHDNGSEPQHALSERLSSSSVAEHHFWTCQPPSAFAGLCILILMTDLTLGFYNASGFIRSNSGSRAA